MTGLQHESSQAMEPFAQCKVFLNIGFVTQDHLAQYLHDSNDQYVILTAAFWLSEYISCDHE